MNPVKPSDSRVPMASYRKRTPKKTYNEPGHAHELTFTCYNRYPFLQAERTCAWLAESISGAKQDLGFSLWAYVFMPEHVHLLVCPNYFPYRIDTILKAIKAPVARKAIEYLTEHSPAWLDRITKTSKTHSQLCFWLPGGGYDRNVTETATLQKMIDYIHQNPCRRGLAAMPEDWKWSSAGWYLGQSQNELTPDAIPPEWGEHP